MINESVTQADTYVIAVNYAAQYGIFFGFLLLFVCIFLILLCCVKKSMKPKTKLRKYSNEIFKITPYETLYENDEKKLISEIKKLNEHDESFVIKKTRLNNIVIQTPGNKDYQDHQDADNKANDNQIIENDDGKSGTICNNHTLSIFANLSGIIVPDNNTIPPVQNRKKIYLCYVFDNVNNDDDESHVFDDLVIFVNIVLKTMNHENVEIIFKIYSPGGSTDMFENAYSQLKRLRDKNFVLTALVDNMCASGGYMLAAACNNIICSEFALIGSIGVTATLHNYYTLSQKLGIIEKTITTGLYKRPFLPGEPLEQIHIDCVGESVNESLDVFKNIVQKSRNFSDEQMTQILSAKTWNGIKALELGLVDRNMCSDDFLNQLLDTQNQIFMINRIELDKESKINEVLALLSKKILTKILSTVIKSIKIKKSKKI